MDLWWNTKPACFHNKIYFCFHINTQGNVASIACLLIIAVYDIHCMRTVHPLSRDDISKLFFKQRKVFNKGDCSPSISTEKINHPQWRSMTYPLHEYCPQTNNRWHMLTFLQAEKSFQHRRSCSPSISTEKINHPKESFLWCESYIITELLASLYLSKRSIFQ